MKFKLIDEDILNRLKYADWIISYKPIKFFENKLQKCFEKLSKSTGTLRNIRKENIIQIDRFSKRLFNLCPDTAEALWSWTKRTDLENLNVVIVENDPKLAYDKFTGRSIVDGMAFSMNFNHTIPSNETIFSAVQNNFLQKYDESNFKCKKLDYWSEQGVLLLNTSWHAKVEDCRTDWNSLTDAILKNITRCQPHAMIWGKVAKVFFNSNTRDLKSKYRRNHTYSIHPGYKNGRNLFVSNKHFKIANDYLKGQNRRVVNWKTKCKQRYCLSPSCEDWNDVICLVPIDLKDKPVTIQQTP